MKPSYLLIYMPQAKNHTNKMIVSLINLKNKFSNYLDVKMIKNCNQLFFPSRNHGAWLQKHKDQTPCEIEGKCTIV